MAVQQITEDFFDAEVVKSDKPVFVDFYAEWCGPCKFTEPIIHDLSDSAEYKDKVKFVKIDVDQNQELASQYSVFSIPTFFIFKNGQPAAQMVGARDRGGFTSEIDKVLS